MIEVRNLTKRFGDICAVNDVSFKIKNSSVVGFLGPNGAGKSTTIRLMSGVLRPDFGTAEICGHDITTDGLYAQSCFGYLPEAAAGFGNLTVREFLTYCGECRAMWGEPLTSAIEQTSDLIELRPALDQEIKKLSKGWRQRAWLAQAILHDPPVLILDEPTDGLDPNQKDKINDLIRQKTVDKTIILSTHILEEVEEVCDRVLLIANGSIVADDKPENLVHEFGSLSKAFKILTTKEVIPKRHTV
jgi:ABC-2 type transport system ATP-binding protein